MQSLAVFTGADYQTPGSLDYTNFLRATQMCTNDVRQQVFAFERAVFNVAFNNRDDHPKNFSYLMSSTGEWKLAPAYDVTFSPGPGGYHQMDVLGEALEVSRKDMVELGLREAGLSAREAGDVIDLICEEASRLADTAKRMFAGQITPETLRMIQDQINDNIHRLK